MVIDHELPVGVDGTIHKTDTVSGARSPGCCEAGTAVIIDIGAVDQPVIKCRWTDSLGVVVQFVNSLVIPIVQKQITKVFVVVGCSRSVDDDSTDDTLPSLEGEVRMVPGGTVLLSLPGVGDALPGSGWALGDRSHTIIRIGVVLANTVEMDTRAIEGCSQGVLDMDHNDVTPIGNESWTGKCAVDGHGAAGFSGISVRSR